MRDPFESHMVDRAERVSDMALRRPSQAVRTYSGLRLLPAVLIMLDADDPVVRAAVKVEKVHRRMAYSCREYIEDQVTVDWDRLLDGRRSRTQITLAGFARSMLEGSEAYLSDLVHFEHGAYEILLRALGSVQPPPQPSIDDILGAP